MSNPKRPKTDDTSAGGISAAEKVFDIPELAKLISSNNEYKDPIFVDIRIVTSRYYPSKEIQRSDGTKSILYFYFTGKNDNALRHFSASFIDKRFKTETYVIGGHNVFPEEPQCETMTSSSFKKDIPEDFKIRRCKVTLGVKIENIVSNKIKFFKPGTNARRVHKAALNYLDEKLATHTQHVTLADGQEFTLDRSGYPPWFGWSVDRMKVIKTPKYYDSRVEGFKYNPLKRIATVSKASAAVTTLKF